MVHAGNVVGGVIIRENSAKLELFIVELVKKKKKYVDLNFRSRILRFNYILGADILSRRGKFGWFVDDDRVAKRVVEF